MLHILKICELIGITQIAENNSFNTAFKILYEFIFLALLFARVCEFGHVTYVHLTSAYAFTKKKTLPFT